MEKAIARLAHYLRFRGLDVAFEDLLNADLRDLGFDDTDMATLIGEIQCDYLKLVDWTKPVHEWRRLKDILDNLTGPDVELWKMFDMMRATWDLEQQVKQAEAAFELAWGN